MESVGTAVILGAMVSALVQHLKNKFETSKKGTLTAVVFLSLVAGVSYYFIVQKGFIEAFVQILGFAGAIYTFIIKRFEEETPEE